MLRPGAGADALSRPWVTLDRQAVDDGVLELRRRGEGDFLICVDGRVLMNSRASRSEEALGRLACVGLGPRARVLVGGLGMGFTLRAVLDALPADAEVVVAELHAVVADWCRGPLGAASGGAVDDPRVRVSIGDVADRIRECAETGGAYDAIVLDLFEGPHAGTREADDPLYGHAAIDRAWRALAPGGVLGVWAEAQDAGFEARLRRRGFEVASHRPGRGGLRHWVVLATRPRSVARSRRKEGDPR